VGSFDGVALVAVEAATPAAATAGARHLAAAFDLEVLLPGVARGSVMARRPAGFPATLPHPGPGVVVIGLRATTERRAEPRREPPVQVEPLAGRHGRTGYGPWRVAGIAVVPPADVADLTACRPLSGQRIHLGVIGQRMTVCGRLPMQGDPTAPGAVDCLRCLRSSLVVARHDRQLSHHDGLAALSDTLVAGAADRLWRRLAHRDPGTFPALLDSMVGAIVHQLPGAPSVDETLMQVRRHRDVASPAVGTWAAEEARQRLTRRLPLFAATHPTRLDAPTASQLGLASDLLDPADAAEVLVSVLEDHGPAPALEPIALRAARRAGDTASERVVRWRRIQSVAQALGSPRR
jgi:hypothetical protein